MTREQVTSWAAVAMSLVASVGAIFSPYIESFDTPAEKIIIILISTVGLSGVFGAVRWVLLWWRYRKLLGTWYYATRRHDDIDSGDTNAALMRFKMGADGELSYEVHLYSEFQALEAVVSAKSRTGSPRRRGTATSRALNFDSERGEIYLVFYVTYITRSPEDQDRIGLLNLSFQPDGTLDGQFSSQLWVTHNDKTARRPSAGHMFATRDLKQLRAHLKAESRAD